jgi:glycosyltransferase involved in cell wall biosynthesis
MKILMTADTIGGVWSYAVELAAQLHRQGIQTMLATMGDPIAPQQRREAQAAGGLLLRESTFKLEWMADPWDDLRRAGDWLLGLEETFRPDVIHLNGYAHAAWPFRAPVMIVAHSCVWTWWRAVKGTNPPDTWNRYREAVAAGLSAAATVVAPTQSMLDALVACYGRPGDALVIPNGRSFAPPESGIKWPFILCAGRLWDEAKNVGLLERAAARVAWPIWLAGETLRPGARPSRAGGVNVLGRLPFPELARWLSRAAIYCLPARYEPFGLGVLEAAICACPLVLGDIASLRETWGRAAVYIDPDDPRELATTLNRLADDPERRQRLGAAARERASRLTPDRLGAAYASLYRRLVTARRGGAAAPEAACAS